MKHEMTIMVNFSCLERYNNYRKRPTPVAVCFDIHVSLHYVIKEIKIMQGIAQYSHGA